MLPRSGDGAERGEDKEVVPSVCSVAQAIRIFCTESLTFCRGCDRTLRPIWVGGPFPARLLLSFNPARPLLLDWPVNALLTRGRSIFLGCASQAQQDCFPAGLPSFRSARS